MKFYGNGAVWDKNKNKVYRFVNGVLETEDKDLIELLRLKYKHEIEIEEVEVEIKKLPKKR